MRIDSIDQVEHQCGEIGPFLIRQFRHIAGKPYAGHSHYVDHIGSLVSGKVRVHWRDVASGETGCIDMLVPSKINMPAGRAHRIEAIEDADWECWFSRAEIEAKFGASADWTQYTKESD